MVITKTKMQFKKVDLGYVIRTAVCVLAFLAAAAYFFYVCKGVADNYLLFTSFTVHAAILWFVNFAVSFPDVLTLLVYFPFVVNLKEVEG